MNLGKLVVTGMVGASVAYGLWERRQRRSAQRQRDAAAAREFASRQQVPSPDQQVQGSTAQGGRTSEAINLENMELAQC